MEGAVNASGREKKILQFVFAGRKMCLCLFLHFAQSILQCQRAKRGVCGFSPPPRYNVLRKGEQQRKQGSAAKSAWRYKATEINLIQTGHRCAGGVGGIGGVGGELLSWERSHDHKKPRWPEWWGNEANGKGMDNSPRLLGKAMLTQSPMLRLATMTLRGKNRLSLCTWCLWWCLSWSWTTASHKSSPPGPRNRLLGYVFVSRKYFCSCLKVVDCRFNCTGVLFKVGLAFYNLFTWWWEVTTTLLLSLSTFFTYFTWVFLFLMTF